MISKKLYIVYLLGVLTFSFIIFSSNKNGITGKAATGCGGAGCHTPSNNTTIQLDGLPQTYAYGTVYNCTLKVINQSQAKAGFDMKVNTGSLSVVAGQGTSLNGVTEMYHNTPKTAVGGVTEWAFKWTAPATGNTNLVVNVSGNAVDGNNQPTNDQFETDAFSADAPGGANNTPAINNISVTSITTNSATINADINANNANTTAVVEYGTTAAYGSSVAMSPSPISGATPMATSANLTGLNANTVYHYRIVANNANGTTNSTDQTFQTAMATNVNNINESFDFILYPNPTIDFLYLNKINNESNTKIYIVSVNGTKQNVNIEKLTDGTYKIQTNKLAIGNYVVIVELNGKKSVYHFIKK